MLNHGVMGAGTFRSGREIGEIVLLVAGRLVSRARERGEVPLVSIPQDVVYPTQPKPVGSMPADAVQRRL